MDDLPAVLVNCLVCKLYSIVMGMSRMVDEWQQSKMDKSLDDGARRSSRWTRISLSVMMYSSVVTMPSSRPSFSLLSDDLVCVPWPQ